MLLFPAFFEYFEKNFYVGKTNAKLSVVFILLFLLCSCLFLLLFVNIFFSFSVNNKMLSKQSFKMLSLKNILHFLRFKITFFAIKSAVLILSFIPVLLIFITVYWFYENSSPIFAQAVMFICALLSFFVFVKFNIGFSETAFLAKYIYFSQSNTKVINSVKQSIEKTKGKTNEIKKLKKSFIFWLPLCFLILPISFVYIYYLCLTAEKGKELMKAQ